MQRARVTAVRSVAHVRQINAPGTAVATALNYAGFGTVLLADYLCKVPLNGGAALDRPAAYDSAVALFQQAVTAAAGDAGQTNLANVGIARSYLNRHDLAHAIE